MESRKTANRPRNSLIALVLVTFIVGLPGTTRQASAQSGDCHSFAETGKAVCGRFLQYWQTHGGLVQQGFPVSESMTEVSDTDGRSYVVQYFERAVFESHPENAPPNDVLLALLGAFRYNSTWFGNAPNQVPSADASSRLFLETGKRVGGAFLRYWNGHGGLAQQGYPISEEFTEVSDLDGNAYMVQYFERAVFEYHPEFAGTANEVLLSQLGTFYLKQRTTAGKSPGLPAQVPPALAEQTPVKSAPTPPKQVKPPRDVQAFADYIATKYSYVGSQALTFDNIFATDISGYHYVALYLDFAGEESINLATKAQAKDWAYAVKNEANAAWGKEDYIIRVVWQVYDYDPCWNCEGDCYSVGDFTSGRGWPQTFTYIQIYQKGGLFNPGQICYLK